MNFLAKKGGSMRTRVLSGLLRYNVKCFVFLLALTVFAIPDVLYGQLNIGAVNNLPAGETVVSNFDGGFATTNGIYLHSATFNDNPLGDTPRRFLEQTGRVRIVSAKNKVGTKNSILVLLSDGSVYVMRLFYDQMNGKPEPIESFQGIAGAGPSQTPLKLFGDALYMLSTSSVYVSRDGGANWSFDTTGLNGAYLNDVTLDTLQYVYAATSKGIYKQHPDSSVWHQNTNAPTGFFQSVFVDRRNRIFAAYYPNNSGKGVYISTNSGGTWTQDSTGLGTPQIAKLNDDAFGNTYALGSGGLFRKSNGVSGWTRIDVPITSLAVDKNINIINDVRGDTVLFAATAFGVFISTNQGTTWTQSNKGVRAENLGGFIRLSNGRLVVITSLGVFYKNAAETTWVKSYPTSGFHRTTGLSRDNSGNLYTEGLPANYFSGAPNVVLKSVDNGLTWNPDSSGISNVPGRRFFYVDENGVQHIGISSNSSTLPLMFGKTSGGTWVVDTGGLGPLALDGPPAMGMGSDGSGNLFVSYFNGNVYRRLNGGSSWVRDTASIVFGGFSKFWRGRNGAVFAYPEFSGALYRRLAGTWSVTASPSGHTSEYINAVSTDSSGAVFAAFRFGSGLGRGVYFTANNGSSWTYAGLDSLTVTSLVSYGDTTYALTTSGTYILTRNSPGTGVETATNVVPGSYSLDQNYPNPFNPRTTISFQTPVRSLVELAVFDILGRRVAELVHQELDAGAHRVEFDASRLATGAYFYRMKSGDFVDTKKLVLLK